MPPYDQRPKADELGNQTQKKTKRLQATRRVDPRIPDEVVFTNPGRSTNIGRQIR